MCINLNQHKVLGRARKTVASANKIQEAGSGVSRSAIEAEEILVVLMNNQDVPDVKTWLSSRSNDSRRLKSYIANNVSISTPVDQIVTNAIREIKNNSLPKGASKIGTNRFPTTTEWQENGGLKNTVSKSDIKSDSNTYSVKAGSTAVRVLDASPKQLTALFLTTLQTLNLEKDVISLIETKLKNIQEIAKKEGSKMSRYHKGEKQKGVGELRKLSMKEHDGMLKSLIETFDTNTRELNKEIDEIFKSLPTNTNFKKAFIHESLSGTEMFGNSLGKANEMITWSSDFSEITRVDMDSAATTISNSFNIPKFVAKTSGGSIRKTVQLFFKSQKNEMNELVNEEKMLRLQMENGVLTENAFVDSLLRLRDRGISIVKKVAEWILSIIQLVYSKLTVSLRRGLSALEIVITIESPESIETDASITYSQL